MEHRAQFQAIAALLTCLPILTLAQIAPMPEVPANFNYDLKTAARLRPSLLTQSTNTSRYPIARQVFRDLTKQVEVTHPLPAWELRIVNDGEMNAFSSPDGTIYVESGLAELAGTSSGLWAAVLSHEIAHVVRRDWGRRYLEEESLRNNGSIVLGDSVNASSTWSDSSKASQDLAQFCRRLEVEADFDGMMLMARAGYHPDFVPALHHMLHAQNSVKTATSIFSMHPRWEDRDRTLDHSYFAAAIEFQKRWPEAYRSPGGNPPTLVFADEPSVKKTHTNEWEIRVPMRCQNLVGSVEVVLRPDRPAAEERQVTGCTSPKTTVTFAVAGERPSPREIFVLDGEGAVLSRAEVPKLGR